MGLWRRYLDWRQRNVFALGVSGTGFQLRQGRTLKAARWDAILSVTAFKHDLLTVDCLCLLLDLGDSLIEVDEQMGQFEPWLRELEVQLGISGEWRMRVLFPAFETNATEIYRRASGRPISTDAA